MKLTKYQKLILDGKICPYCGEITEFVDSIEIYGVSYGMCYICRDCDAYVSVHNGTDRALGRVAKKELRKLKHEAHEYFDQIWKLGFMKRCDAYRWLSGILGIPYEYTHIGMFREDTCRSVVAYSKLLLNDFRRIALDNGEDPKTPPY